MRSVRRVRTFVAKLACKCAFDRLAQSKCVAITAIIFRVLLILEIRMIQIAKRAVTNEDSFERNDQLEDEIAELVANIDAATYRLLVLLHEFDNREGWGWGFRNCAHWLSW